MLVNRYLKTNILGIALMLIGFLALVLGGGWPHIALLFAFAAAGGMAGFLLNIAHRRQGAALQSAQTTGEFRSLLASTREARAATFLMTAVLIVAVLMLFKHQASLQSLAALLMLFNAASKAMTLPALLALRK
jgi:hypothetical protein